MVGSLGFHLWQFLAERLLATLLYYDQPEYDIFWQMVSDLDVPIYFHPRNNIAQIFLLSYGHALWLAGPGQEYAVTLSNHILG